MTAALVRRQALSLSIKLISRSRCSSRASRVAQRPIAGVLSSQDGRPISYNHFVGGQSEPISSNGAAIRLAVKDNIATADLPTQCAAQILASHVSPYEATIVQQLRQRGARVVGKTNMDEFGMGSHSLHSAHGPVRSPLTVEDGGDGGELSAGGSSGGSAVAVQVGDADLALGTDTGGSVRLPAAYTGTVGYKPSYGMLSRFGVVPYANSLDTVGLLATRVRPIREMVFDTGLHREHDAKDPTSLSPASRASCAKACPPELPELSQITVGIPLEYNIEELDLAIRASWTLAAEALESRGVRVVPVSLPATRQALSAYYVLAPAEASSNLAKYDGVRYGVRASESGSDAAGETLYSETRGGGFGAEVRRRILLGTYSLSSEAIDNYFLQAQRVRRLVQRDFDRVFRLGNPLRAESSSEEQEQFDLSELPEAIELDDKRGPAQVDFLLCPTAPTFPPRIKDLQAQDGGVDVYVNDVFTVPASLAGLPAVSVPARTGGKLPAGLQLIGQFWDDERLLKLAEQLEEMVAP